MSYDIDTISDGGPRELDRDNAQEPQESVLTEEPTDYTVESSIGQNNLCDFFSETKLSEIGAEAIRYYDMDMATFKPRRDRIESLYKLALQTIEAKDYPFPGASNVKYPLLTKAALSFASLAYPAIVQDQQVVKGKAVGKDEGDKEILGPDGKPMLDQDTGKVMKKNAGAKGRRATRVSTFMSWQILEDMDGWEDDTDKLLHIIPIIGCAFKKSWYDNGEMKNVSTLVLPQYLVPDPHAKTCEGAQRLSEEIELYPNEIEEAIRLGVFRAFDYKYSPAALGDEYKPVEGAVAPPQDDTKPHVFIEQHTWLDLDNDGYKEPYVLMVHRSSSKVARILPRFDRRGIKRSEDGQVAQVKPECYYSKFDFFPDPEGGFNGIGFGHLLQHLNEAANTSINQLIDSGHRYVMGGGFIGKGLRLKGGDLKFKPGEYKRADSTGEDIRMNVFPLPMPEPSAVLFTLMDFLIKSAEDMSQMARVMAGDIPANMPATTALASIEQGMQPFKAVFKRIHRALNREFKRLFELNQKYLPQEKYSRVMDDPEAIIEQDFDADLIDVIPVSDPEMVNSTQQRIRAAALAEWKDDPLIDPVEVRKRVLKALGEPDIESLVKVPPPVNDELTQAQITFFQAQTEDLNRKNEREDIRLAIDIEKAQPERHKIMADAVKSLAQAEAEENAPEVMRLKAQLDAMANLSNQTEKLNGNIKRGNQPVEARPSEPEGEDVPAGLPEGPVQ